MLMRPATEIIFSESEIYKFRPVSLNLGSHYSIGMSTHLGDFGIACADKIWELTGGNPEQVVLFYSGMSGTSLATAIVTAQMIGYGVKSRQMYVRKVGEKSHGCEIEFCNGRHDYGGETKYYIFVDDMLDKGTTFQFCRDRVKKYLSDEDNYQIPVLTFMQYPSAYYSRFNQLDFAERTIPQSNVYHLCKV